MATTEAYMLKRDGQESKRLDFQHEFMRALSGGHLVHPSIPRKAIRTVADVATGTGIWLRDVAASAEFSTPADSKGNDFVGFDISPQQFPSTETSPSNARFVVHDMTEPFPVEYRERFDLVNVRLISYAIQAVDLEKAVRHILQILRPGGFLQCQEGDACDTWTTSETPMAIASINHVISEKIARGLLPGIAAPLLETIIAQSTPIPDGQMNPISRSSELMRITHLETISTLNHSSPTVAAGKKPLVPTTATAFLEAGVHRRKAIIADPSTPTGDGVRLRQEIEEMEKLIKAFQHDDDQAYGNWEFETTWIVARKAFLVNDGDAWMSAKYPA